MTLSTQYDSFTLSNELTVVAGEGGLPIIKVANKHAEALISIYGAQVLSFKQKPGNAGESHELLFLSEKAFFEEGKAIKGGIPICWPWFGQAPEATMDKSSVKNPKEKNRPAHGFARNVLWELVETASNNADGTQVVLALQDSKNSRKLWPHAFNLSLTINIGKTLKLSLKTTNTGAQAFSITQALHSYFSVSDIAKVRVVGLDKAQYLDATFAGKKQDWPIVVQSGDITFDKEVDRIYTQAPALSLIDDGRSQSLKIRSSNSNTTVIWNPWVDLSANSVDLSDDAYKQFVCIETANAAEGVIEILPGESFALGAEYSLS